MKAIVVIEDDHAIADLLGDLLEDAGYRVRIAPNGREGPVLLDQELPDLGFCDVMMPILDGRAVCQHLQSTPRYQGIALVMMSAGVSKLPECGAQAF